ncbi:hypothetical protein ACH5RR_023467 [Cinchona calisaya]|uniref:O-fucosyltransferase family protein n=1 Tax=Cinchona calisaya TaxID=153742 RepID=A0ABD2ZE24_9GENT
MAVSKSNKKKLSYISVPSQIINSISSTSFESLLLYPKKKVQSSPFSSSKFRLLWKNSRFWLFLLLIFGFFGMLKMFFNADPLIPFAPNPCAILEEKSMVSNGFSSSQLSVVQNGEKIGGNDEESGDVKRNEFWKQPDGLGYRPCLEFSNEYKKASVDVVKDRTKYLMVVAAGGMNHEFSDIFDLEHFKKVLENDVRIVSSLPSTHVMTRPLEEKLTPLHATPEWIRSRYSRRIRRDGVLLLRSLDSRLAKDLPSDLQKLRCKVAFHALRFAPSILELGNKLTERMRSKGLYLALHLRMEKDLWVRTGCLPGLSHEYDEMINNERKQTPELLTSRSNMTYYERKLAGLCPLNALEVARLLKALGTPKTARIFWAGGNPLGGKEALQPITREFPNFYNKQDLALPGELEPFQKKASLMAAVDYIISENSDVFMPSHGGNMGHAIQGHRAYAGHKKTITPNKRQMFSHFMNSSLPEAEFNRIILGMHQDSLGQLELRSNKAGRDVTKYPLPECMCNKMQPHSSL